MRQIFTENREYDKKMVCKAVPETIKAASIVETAFVCVFTFPQAYV